MAGTIGRITAAVTSVHNENAASLANLNFDFTLVKLEAPPEYSALGTTISKRRKVDAEEGGLHKTARKLGALFKEVLPPAEELFRAYGTRVSEISQMPSINPRIEEGIFGSHMGADTASIWAAATSGSAALSAHLLGCMLARMFTVPEAISVWVELIEKQKQLICASQQQNLFAQESQAGSAAGLQEISRAELARWDASARAWLQSADEAKSLQQKQTRLILDNASVPVNNEPDTYSSVLKAWQVALEAMNNLAKGMPQTVQDGAALLAISSWHLYPDMTVYGGPMVEVKQKDPLFKPSALLTLGLQHVRDDKKSVYWSIPLACLQHYGYPIRTFRTAGSDSARITYQQFAYIVLGCLFVCWGEFSRTNEEGLKWIQRVGDITQLSKTDSSNQNLFELGWLRYLIQAADEFQSHEYEERRTCIQLMNLGRRRPMFLYGHPRMQLRMPPPLFGLSQVKMLLSVLNAEGRVQFLRERCSHLKINTTDIIIVYTHDEDGETVKLYASIIPLPRQSSKRMRDGTVKHQQSLDIRHRRWIILTHLEIEICHRRRDDFLDITRTKKLLETYRAAELTYSQGYKRLDTGLAFFIKELHSTPERQHRLVVIKELSTIVFVAERRRRIEALGEDCMPVMSYVIDQQHDYHYSLEGLIFSQESDFEKACSDILDKYKLKHQKPVAVCKNFYVGHIETAALYSIYDPKASLLRKPPLEEKLSLSPKDLEKHFEVRNFDVKKLYKDIKKSSEHVAKEEQYVAEEEYRCLRACFQLTEIYKLLPGATISTLVVGQYLRNAKWISNQLYKIPGMLNLPQTFACVAMFESGNLNIDPNCLNEVFAMSSGNSLYVSAALLCDPFEKPRASELRRVIGNIGRSGITFLISPPEVKTRQPNPEKWMSINHGPFEGNSEDCFRDTSIHLSFTEYEIPVLNDDDARHVIDRSAVLLESLTSVFEGGLWVAEIDILKAIRTFPVRAKRYEKDHIHHPKELATFLESISQSYTQALKSYPELAAISVENWDEFIEAPSSGIIAVQAHKNWLARLAITAMCVKHGLKPIILPEDPCWVCLVESLPTAHERIALIC